VSIVAAVREAASLLTAATRPRVEGHAVIQGKVEELTPDELSSAICVYADPPYTAQQYSRFYHVLELAVDGRARVLQEARFRGVGSVTSGLYGEGKFLSDFCRSSTALGALRRVVELSRRAGASLLLSYSGSVTGNTGNRRLITMDQILALVRELYGDSNVQIDDLSIAYRPFNTASVSGRDDREFLVVGRAT
jgi:adenine-specific DNA methylase